MKQIKSTNPNVAVDSMVEEAHALKPCKIAIERTAVCAS
jgi:hypothetical protein